MKKKKNPIFTDLILFFGLLFVGILLFLCVSFFSKKGASVLVSIDGTPYGSWSLSSDVELVLHGVDGQNTLCIQNQKVFISSADCPDLICVHHKPISRVGEQIVCLPHRIVVSIEGNDSNKDASFDAISQ